MAVTKKEIERQLIVGFVAGTTKKQAKAVLNKHPVTAVRWLSAVSIAIVSVKKGVRVEVAIASLQKQIDAKKDTSLVSVLRNEAVFYSLKC